MFSNSVINYIIQNRQTSLGKYIELIRWVYTLVKKNLQHLDTEKIVLRNYTAADMIKECKRVIKELQVNTPRSKNYTTDDEHNSPYVDKILTTEDTYTKANVSTNEYRNCSKGTEPWRGS